MRGEWKSSRERRQVRKARERSKTLKRAGLVGLIAVGVVGYFAFSFIQKANLASKAFWEDVPDQGAEHIPDSTTFDEYNSNPPTSGPHYSQPARAGFYDDPVPAGNLIHSMEHGYVIIWYNCDGLLDTACGELKVRIQKIMEDERRGKLIAVPWDSMETTIALTAWTKIDRLDIFDDTRIRAFIAAFRSKAGPEPNAP